MNNDDLLIPNYIKLAVKTDIDEEILDSFVDITNQKDVDEYTVYTFQPSNLFLLGELTSFVFDSINYYIFNYELGNTSIDFDSLCRIYQDCDELYGIIHHSAANAVSLIINSDDYNCDKTTLLTAKTRYGLFAHFYKTYPGVKIIHSELQPTPEEHVSVLDFYHEKIKGDVQIYTSPYHQKVLFTHQDPEPIITQLEELRESFGVVIPGQFTRFGFFGFYLQTSGFEIIHQSPEWVCVRPSKLFSIAREYIVSKDALLYDGVANLTATDILADAIMAAAGYFTFYVKTPNKGNHSIFAVTRACFNVGAMNMGMSIDDDYIKVNFNLFNFKEFESVLTEIQAILASFAGAADPPQFEIHPQPDVAKKIGAEDIVETCFLLSQACGTDYALYQAADKNIYVIHKAGINLDAVLDDIDSDVPAVDTELLREIEPITNESVGEMPPWKRMLLTKLGNNYYLLNSLIVHFQHEAVVNQTQPRDPMTRALVSQKEKIDIGNKIYEIYKINKHDNIPSRDTEIVVDRTSDEDYIHIYLTRAGKQYSVAYLPQNLPSESILQPVDAIVDLTVKFHDLEILLNIYFDFDWSLHSLLCFDDCLDVYNFISIKGFWVEHQDKLEAYNEVCRMLEPYF